MLDLSQLTAQQRRVYPHWKEGLEPLEIMRKTGLIPSRIRAIFAELKLIEKHGGRRSAAQATKSEREIAARLAKQPVCPRCFLRGEHECLSGAPATERRGWV